MTWTVNLSPVNYSSLACLKVRISALSTLSKLYLKLNTFPCPLIEHTTGLCKSYEDKHIALQEKLRESSLRCEYLQKTEERIEIQHRLFNILMHVTCQWVVWKRWTGGSITPWAPVNWSKWMNPQSSSDFRLRTPRQSPHRPPRSPSLRTSSEYC